jgi:hypothetical protein
MIEFRGAFYKNKTSPPQSVLVQFDGILLHIWNISHPFHRILSSDEFELPFTLKRHRPCVRLPRGGRIETDDTQALTLLKASDRLGLAARFCKSAKNWHAAILYSALVAALTLGVLAGWLFIH